MICVSDGYDPAQGTREAFMSAMADAVNLEFRKAGAPASLVIEDVRWTDDLGAQPIATVCARPGGNEGPLTVGRLRDFLARKMAAQLGGDDGQRRLL